MRKEVVFAVTFGVLIGLIFAFGLFRINNTMKNNLQSSTSNEKQSLADNNDEINDSPETLTLLKPFNQQVFGTDSISLTGITEAGSYVIATGGPYDSVTTTSDNGSFEMDYEINAALNNLTIYSISPDDMRTKTNLDVVYSSEAGSTDVSDEIENNVEDKLEQAQKRSEFYEGTITDITEGGIQIKNCKGEIQQVSYDEDSTSFAKIGKTTTSIALSDIAIGDYILALGYKNGNSLLHSFRILVSEPSTSVSVQVFYGTVIEKNKADMEISQKDLGNLLIEIDNNSKTYQGDTSDPERVRFADIDEGDVVIGTYTSDKDINTARRIYILKKAEE